MGDEQSKSLTRREFDAVIRRAAELSSSGPDASEGNLTEAEVFRIAREVGLSDRDVRTALSEVRGGVGSGGVLERIFGPSSVRAVRVVPGTPESLSATLDDFFTRTQLLQSVRRGKGVLQYRPSLDWMSQLARAASFASRKHYVASAKSVEVHLDRVDDASTLVEIVVDPGTRSDSVAGAFGGGGAVGVATGGMAAVLLATGGAPVAVAAGVGLVLGGGVVGGFGYGFGQSHKKKLVEVQAEVEGILDLLEHEESLEPPPASWRSWVKRQFHGVARDLRALDEDLRGGSPQGPRRDQR